MPNSHHTSHDLSHDTTPAANGFAEEPAVTPMPAVSDTLRGQIGNLSSALTTTVYGQESHIKRALAGILAGGHLLLMGVPGVAKTRLVLAIGKLLGFDMRRIQGTPDLQPADIVGLDIIEPGDYGRQVKRFIPGPIFCQMLMVDEINRINPRTQAALLQAMQEGTVTVDGREHALPTPFHVIATQNPLEYESVWPLPEAQRDRFMMRLDIPCPDEATECQIVHDPRTLKMPKIRPHLRAEDVLAIQTYLRSSPLNPDIVQRIVRMIRRGRPESSTLASVQRYVLWGPGPRAGQALALAARAYALLNNRLDVTEEDITAVTYPTLCHRMALKAEAHHANVKMDTILSEVIGTF